ncbi:IS5 family transposase, partial [Leptospira weilii]|uniref:IS5 family transposase n=1 Tax=Leptospira weilii TaxID=28184 RepID=UPI0012DA3BCB
VHNRKIKITERMDLSNDQWKILEPLIIEPNVREDGKGRPRMDARSILNGILWILRTGAQWKELPDRYPPYQTCHRRFQEWNRNGTMRNMIRSLASDLKERGGIDIEESFIDGTFVPAKKGVQKWGKPNVGRVQRSWQSETAKVFLSPFARKMLRPMKSR